VTKFGIDSQFGKTGGWLVEKFEPGLSNLKLRWAILQDMPE
jgi:hypothetical protein